MWRVWFVLAAVSFTAYASWPREDASGYERIITPAGVVYVNGQGHVKP